MPPSQSPIISAHYNHLRHGGHHHGRGHHHQNGSNGSSPASRHNLHNGHSPSLGGMTTDSGTTASGSSKIKCVFLGDGAVGKTSLIVSYTTNGYPNEYIPTAIDTYDVVVHVDGEPVTFEMCDTPGQDDFDTLRPLVYPNTDVFLICFSVVSPSSFSNVKEKWVAEIKKSRNSEKGKGVKANVPMILVGTQSDLRNDVNTRVELAKYKEQPVSENEAKKLANSLGCECYIETSALTQHNLKEVFDEAIMAGLKGRKMKEKKAAKKAQRTGTNRGCAPCAIL